MYKQHRIIYPKMQRNAIWTVKDQSELIESLIRGIPIPPIYMNRKQELVTLIEEDKDGKQVEKERMAEVWEILDGRQRTTALFDFFINNNVKINSNLPEKYECLKDYRYGDIEENNPNFAGQFKGLHLPVVWMDNAPEELKKEFFQKLNKGGKVLTQGELAHSSLNPANEYMSELLHNSFYETHVKKNDRFAEYVPLAKIVHFILRSFQVKTKTFEYNPTTLNAWQDRIVTNKTKIQTDLDDLHEHRNQALHPHMSKEISRVNHLITEIFGSIEIEKPNNFLLINMIYALLILEDKQNPNAMSHDMLKKAFKSLVKVWDDGHSPLLRSKMKKDMANISNEEGQLINECNKLETKSKSILGEVLENIQEDIYSSYI